MIRDGKGHVVGFLDHMDGESVIARDKRGHPVSKYWGEANLTTDLRTGKYLGRGDQTMRTLCDDKQ